ncbi:hypothetical protein Stsp02_11620 [Streptomyces sp. NBRC 14336]|uniref:phage tail tape measure protein n=1 Tax=Streptomyces sp. NBRC 14336 TaxID=3030992 RepID=UPI0024A011DC|nr:phage tail tape measure protein [Streptomyces sp. NBRC 14336]GLW45500.1 hypothetical protein Stsp02_11620 [Streptomyces sp. NBRC 14336]
MALTVGELRAIMSVDDRAVDPALRRVENAMRQTGQQLGSDAEAAGQDAGHQLGQGLVRGADGQWRTMRGELVDAATAAVAEAEAVMRRGGQRIAAAAGRAGDQAGDALADGIADGAEEGVQQATSRMDRLKTAAAGAGLAVGAVLVSGMQEALDQGQITARLGAQLGTTPAVTKQYGQVAGQLFKEAIVGNFQEGADAIKAVAGSGLLPPGATNAQIQSIATNAHDLADVMEVDVGMAAQAAGTMVRNGLAKNGKEAFDLLVAGSKGLGKAGEDLLETFTEYSPIFAEAGLSGQTAMGLIRQAVQGGWGKDTDKVADAFKELQLRVGEGGKAAADSLKALGLDYKQVIEDMRAGGKRGEGAMDQVTDKLRELGPTSDVAKQAVKDLFGGPGEDLGATAYKLDVDQAAKSMDGAKDSADDLGNGLRDGAGHNLTEFRNKLQQNVVEFLGSNVVPALSKAFGWVQDHQGMIKGGAAIITALVVPALLLLGGKALWAGIQMARAWVMALGPIGWIGLAIAGLVILVIAYWDEVKKYTLAAWDWVVDKLVWAKDAALAAIDWLGTIPGKIAEWFGEAKDWAVRKLTELVSWLGGLPGRVIAAISAMAGLLIGKANESFQGFKDAAAKKATAFVTWVAGLPGRISRGIGSLTSLLYTKGQNVVQGLWNGIKSMGGWIKSQLISWAKSAIPGPIAKALGIGSPSKVTAAQGRWIGKGLVKGLTGSKKQVQSAADKLADIVRKSLSGKKERAALKKINKAGNSLSFLAGWDKKVEGQLKDARKKLEDLRKERDKLSADVKKGVLQDADITKQDTGGWPQTAETILAGLKQDTLAAQTFAKNLAALRKKGVRADLIAQIAQAGVSGGSSAAAALANANASQVKQINAQQKMLVNAAGQAGTTAGDAMYGAGIRAAQGLVKGLVSHQRYIDKTMANIAKSMQKSIKKALGIKSPSRVMALVGQYTAQGLIRGVEGERTAVNRTMASLVETPAPGSWDLASSRARAAASQKVVLELRSSGRAEDDYLIERMRRGVKKRGGGDVELVLGGRRAR